MQRFVLAFSLFALAQGCSDNDFTSSGKKRGADAVRADGKGNGAPSIGDGGDLSKPQSNEGKPDLGKGSSDEGGDGSDADLGSDLGEGGDPDAEAIGKCLEKWGSANPFGEGAGFRKVHASVQVLGAGKGIVDDIRTEKPELVLITAAVSVLGKTEYQLMNPNGWYCLKVDVNVLTNVTVKLECAAHMADNKVDVGVLSNSQPVGGVGVHVLSDVAIERQKRGGAQCE